jgi:hypothetical protein
VTARQATGPSLYAGQPNAKLPKRGNGFADKAGDAKYPLAGAQIVKAKNHPTLDLRGTTVALRGSNVEIRMRLTQTAALGTGVPASGTTDSLTRIEQAKYLTRFDVRGHVFYAGATVAANESAKPAFFAGEVGPNEKVINPAYGPGAPYGNTYAALAAATGRIDGKDLVVTVPAATFGVRKGDKLATVTSFAMIGELDSNPTAALITHLPFTVDATPSFDTVLK